MVKNLIDKWFCRSLSTKIFQQSEIFDKWLNSHFFHFQNAMVIYENDILSLIEIDDSCT